MKKLLVGDDGHLDEAIPFCLGERLGIELQSFAVLTQPELYPALVEQHLEKIQGMPCISFHGLFGDLNCGSYDPLIREVSRQRLDLSYQTAVRLGATHIVFHHGYVPHTSLEKNWIRRMAQFWKAFLKDKPAEVFFHLENMLELSPDILIESLDLINDPRLGACLDVGHSNCNSNAPVLVWVERLGKRITYVHLHDNDGTGDQHLGIGRGNIPFKQVCAALQALAPEAIWALETQVSGLRDSYGWLRENGFVRE
jgi:sugar phosphate isomerase/epimerase